MEGRMKRNASRCETRGVDDLDAATCHKFQRLDRTTAAASTSKESIRDKHRVGRQKDWRQILCNTLGAADAISDNDLEAELQEAIADKRSTCSPESEIVLLPPVPEPFYKILHRVRCSANPSTTGGRLYSEKPVLSTNDDARISSHLSGMNEVSDLHRYMERNRGLSFVVIFVYVCCDQMGNTNPQDPLSRLGEIFVFESPVLCTSLEAIHLLKKNETLFPKVIPRQEYDRLQYVIYWHQEKLETLVQTASEDEKDHLICFRDYFQRYKKEEFYQADELFRARLTTRTLLPYLFIPTVICIIGNSRGRDHYQGVQLVAWPNIATSWSGKEDGKMVTTTFDLKVMYWEYDGNFRRAALSITSKIHWRLGGTHQVPGFEVYPFRLADDETQRLIEQRGRMFWSCRLNHCISYNGWDYGNQENFKDTRFIIDARSYKAALKSQPQITQGSSNSSSEEDFQDDLGQKAMCCEDPPGDDFILLLPTWMNGFCLDDKKSLLVARMANIAWDDKAFHSLVLHPDTKDVIKALITYRTSSSFSTDLIRGKGSGLVLLLHGPPGTGKTLTAESVADHAKKALYRVTCGDIGTQPEAVERYLTRLLRLAKLWDLVLLDEAEVFLQERSLTDLQRNALVSVFLRVLEYYDGILILTSNRVGTLDEGFKSRIQLALEYPKLNSNARMRVWENFVNSLESDAEASAEIDIPDLRRHLRDLSVYELNGREIRNAINVARPLALSTGTQVDFKCLKKVIGVQGRFGQYIQEINEGLDDEKVAREEGKR
ncbi:hypothetical protein NM208_g6199 [Fusarium decemcellulare]|uniref:Uncharacterized protein n=1 Tax=Fusarium decemcellulare TaxID=57161 RepID=A0ACC1SE52_9HYPO|nr:hypothetical protein NM208_g6199 [Fusarium decemcellulare]